LFVIVAAMIIFYGDHRYNDHFPAGGVRGWADGPAAASASDTDGQWLSVGGWSRFGYESSWVLSAARTWP